MQIWLALSNTVSNSSQTLDIRNTIISFSISILLLNKLQWNKSVILGFGQSVYFSTLKFGNIKSRDPTQMIIVWTTSCYEFNS